jgi:hypothetical protein
MPTPTITWNLDANGDWATAADWTPHRLPNSTDDVAINTAHLHAVTHSTGTHTVNSLTVGNDIFIVSGGSLTVNSTSSFATLLSVSGGIMRFAGAATAAAFSQSGGTVSGAATLTVTGPSAFASTFRQTGPGRTVLEGAATFSSAVNIFAVDGGRTLENRGVFTVAQSSEIILGFNPFGANVGAGTFKNDAAGTLDLQINGEIQSIGASGSRFINAGTLEKTGGGTSIIGVDTKDIGSMEVVSGKLQFFLALTGGGSLAVDSGATLEADSPVGGALKVIFNGGGTLRLNDPASFAATIRAFGAGDTIDLLSRTATSATLGAGDTLVIKNGTTTVATLQLAGNHAGDTFHVVSDGHGGTNITVTSGPARAAPFIAAMAAVGAGGGGMAYAMNGPHAEARPPMLSSVSRAHFA